MKAFILRGVIVAALVTCVASLMMDLFFARGYRVAIPSEQFAEINAMPHSQALEALRKHQKPIRGLAYVWDSYRKPRYWRHRLGPLAAIFLPALAGCLWIGNWSRKNTLGEAP